MPTLKESNFISIIIYLRNCEKNVEAFFRSVNSIFKENFKKYEIIFVDDASIDESLQIVKKTSASIDGPMISVLHMSYYQGVERAMNAGGDLAIGDFVFEFDSTWMAFEPSLIMEVYKHSLEGYDIVSAAPTGGARGSSKLFYNIYNKYSKSVYPLKTETFRVLSRRIINRVQAMSSTVPYRKALYANSGLKQDTIYYTPKQAMEGIERPEVEMRKGVAMDSLVLFTDVAYKATFGLAIIMMVLTLIMAIYALTIFLTGSPVAGWTTTMLFLTISFFGVFIILAIIIKYLSVLINLVFQRQNYVIESIEKVTRS